MIIIETLAPVFTLIALGGILRKSGFLDRAGVKTLNRCCYWIGLPSLLFLKIGFEPLPEGDSGKLILVLLAATALLLISALAIGSLIRLPAKQRVTFMHVSFRGNLAYVGLPVVLYAFDGRPDSQRVGAMAAIGLGVCVVAYNIIAVMLHLVAQHQFSLKALRQIILKTITNPLLLACLAGFGWQSIGGSKRMPLALTRTLSVAGQFALPLALLCVGSALVTAPLRQVAATSALASVLKTLAGPGFGLLLANIAGLSQTETSVICILMATPTAIASYVLTGQLGGDESLAAGTIALSTLLSLASFALVIGLRMG